ncbi:MAG: hypothetical protein NTY51_13440, partial [Deltaproteobacteria bacterium]|nr:hypothetical protein [Deltaproteobacteria bacterium]
YLSRSFLILLRLPAGPAEAVPEVRAPLVSEEVLPGHPPLKELGIEVEGAYLGGTNLLPVTRNRLSLHQPPNLHHLPDQAIQNQT